MCGEHCMRSLCAQPTTPPRTLLAMRRGWHTRKVLCNVRIHDMTRTSLLRDAGGGWRVRNMMPVVLRQPPAVER